MGRMIEDMEFKLRNSLDQIYFGKTRDITNQLRVAGLGGSIFLPSILLSLSLLTLFSWC